MKPACDARRHAAEQLWDRGFGLWLLHLAAFARRAQAPARGLRFEAVLLLVDGRRRRVLQADDVVEHSAPLVHLAIADPALAIKRTGHLEPMPVRVIGNNRWIVLA